MAAGIEVRHGHDCRSRVGGRCSCDPSYRAHVWSKRDRKRIRKTFPTLAAAKNWRKDAQVAVRDGVLRPLGPLTLEKAAQAWLAGARDGSVRNRSGDRYKPSAIRRYDNALRLRVLTALGSVRLSELRVTDLQELVDKLVAEAVEPSSIRNAIIPIRAIYRRALSRGQVAVNPTAGLELPAVRSRRPRIASPQEASELLAALPRDERALWATAMYAGLRLGELRALRLEEIDTAAGLIYVERSWDPYEGEVAPKTAAGRRRVPITAALRDYLVEHRMSLNRADGLAFGRDATRPFATTTVWSRARRAWEAAELRLIGLHECRHTFASLMIAAGVNAKALSSYMGHASIAITLDLYGHLMPGAEDEAAELLDTYLQKRSDEQLERARNAPVGQPWDSPCPTEAVDSGRGRF